MKDEQQIVGVYFCNSNILNDQTPVYIEKLAATIKKQTGSCVIAVLKNTSLCNFHKDKLHTSVSIFINWTV